VGGAYHDLSLNNSGENYEARWFDHKFERLYAKKHITEDARVSLRGKRCGLEYGLLVRNYSGVSCESSSGYVSARLR
jgi:hypothetical protein